MGGALGDFLTDRMCCPLGLHVSLPRRLRLWHRPLPLGLFLGGVQPGALCLPASNRHPPCSHAAALEVGGEEGRRQKCKSLNYGFPPHPPEPETNILPTGKTNVERLAPPQVMRYTSPALRLARREL